MGEDNGSLTLVDAARATGIDRRTLRKQIDDGTFPGAFRQETARGPGTGSWRIPTADLTGAGYTVDQVNAPRPTRAPESTLEIERLRAELAEEHTLRLVAEAVAAERGAALEDARLAMRALANGTTANGTSANGSSTNGTTANSEPRDRDGIELAPRPARPRGHWLR